jgi:hypothetical protein
MPRNPALRPSKVSHPAQPDRDIPGGERVILLVTRQAEGQIGHAGKMLLCQAASLSSKAGSASTPTMVASVPVSPANRAPQPQRALIYLEDRRDRLGLLSPRNS